MKKVIVTILFIILIPYLVVTIFIKNNEIKFKFISNNFVRVKRENTNLIEEIPFEEYVKGVLAGEMPSSFHIEALKAQAVAARTYVLKKMEENKSKDYDIVDTIKNQVYLDDETLKKNWGKNYTKNINKIKQAIIETKGWNDDYTNSIRTDWSWVQRGGRCANAKNAGIFAFWGDPGKENQGYTSRAVLR